MVEGALCFMAVSNRRSSSKLIMYWKAAAISTSLAQNGAALLAYLPVTLAVSKLLPCLRSALSVDKESKGGGTFCCGADSHLCLDS